MRPYFLIFIFCFLGSYFPCLGNGIDFFTGSWAEALEKAKSQDKLIFVDAYATWCGPCKRMAKTVFTREEAGAFYNKNFINFKIDMESGPGTEFGRKYPVSAYPTLFFIDGNGKVVLNTRGAQNLESLLKLGKSALEKGMNTQDLERQYADGNRDPKFLLKYVKALNKTNKSTLRIANEYLRNQENLNTDFNREFIYESLYQADSKIFDLLVSDRKAITSIYSPEQVNNQIEKACRRTFSQALKFESSDLWQEARTKAAEHLEPDGRKLAMEFDIDYYAYTKESKSYLKTTKAYVKTYVKNNAALLDATAKRLLTDFESNPKILHYAESIAAKASENGGLAEYHQTYARVLLANGNQSKALYEAQKALTIAKKYGAYTRDIEMLIQKIEDRQ